MLEAGFELSRDLLENLALDDPFLVTRDAFLAAHKVLNRLFVTKKYLRDRQKKHLFGLGVVTFGPLEASLRVCQLVNERLERNAASRVADLNLVLACFWVLGSLLKLK